MTDLGTASQAHGARVERAMATNADEQRWNEYAKFGPCIARYEADGTFYRVYEMMPAELELKIVAVPARGSALPFFTLEGFREHARRFGWKEAA